MGTPGHFPFVLCVGIAAPGSASVWSFAVSSAEASEAARAGDGPFRGAARSPEGCARLFGLEALSVLEEAGGSAGCGFARSSGLWSLSAGEVPRSAFCAGPQGVLGNARRRASADWPVVSGGSLSASGRPGVGALLDWVEAADSGLCEMRARLGLGGPWICRMDPSGMFVDPAALSADCSALSCACQEWDLFRSLPPTRAFRASRASL